MGKLHVLSDDKTGNQTVVCAISSTFLNCTCFPQRIQIPINPPLTSVSGVVGGNGFICAVSSSYPSSTSVMVCWRFSNLSSNMTYKRIYIGPYLTDLNSGNSHICGLVNGSNSNSLHCWQWRNFNFNHTVNNISSSLAVGENFVCGLSDLGEIQCLGSDDNVFDQMPRRNFSRVGAGFRHVCAISISGSLECWGNMAGERPEGEFTSLALGENRSCAIRSNGTVICWGENGFALPELLRDESFIAIEAKRTIFCGVVTSNYSLFCWGNEGFDSNPLVFSDVVPGPCRTRTECGCGPLPNYGEYCEQGLMICQPCVKQPSWTILPPPRPPPPPSLPPPAGKKWNSKMVAFLVIGCVGSFSLLLAVCIFLFSRYFKIRGSRVHDSGRLEEGGSPQPSGQMPQPQPAPPVLEKKLSYMISMGNGGHLEEFSLEILLKATENFSEEHKIGSGSFGSVYHATLDDGREVAIKRAEISSSSSYAGATKRGGQEDKDLAFLNELEFLSRLNHKNLIIRICEDGNERVLVHEYMENGTLFDHLHKLPFSPLTSWAARIKVALDAARGIEYLHEYAIPRVIHRDIKSSNILLDATWTARVSDLPLVDGPQATSPTSHYVRGDHGVHGPRVL
ncbi:LOW QUALITY PROTEIN: hypothetical protein DH2020_036618 [Rehmannia glutinosa]|uniref:Protein kinase domain-containing protein n=1 Tax=Rehmannia glutinosa TaxID=99300 RepID=A0ABR0V6D2_REHGL